MEINAKTIGTQAYPAFTFPPLKRIYPAPTNVKIINNMVRIKANFFIIIFSAYPDSIASYKDLQLVLPSPYLAIPEYYINIPKNTLCFHIFIKYSTYGHLIFYNTIPKEK